MVFTRWLAALPLFAALIGADSPDPAAPGRIEHLANFPSRFVKPRNVDVWLPEGYPQPGTRYAVLYMQDGQNLFNPKNSYGGVAWEVDSTLAALSRSVRPCIVVGIWNTDRRFTEYAPARPYAAMSLARREKINQERPGQPLSDEYLKFIVRELKPYVDKHFQTAPRRANTFVAGSSMGGLISLYAALEYPNVFGGAACFSTHWPLSLKENTPDFTSAMVQYLDRKLPRRHRPKLYFDYGSATLDARYQPHQLRVDSVMRAHGYDSTTWRTRSFPGAAHNEAAWKKRVPLALPFLLGRR
ncbi:alpha/beta hydrolase [Hymenobacter antarcticus]|uniref:Alpha/beta hydrolase-fold protein n=1 Tax=Hymenobacter antarcticus TaxID=486270 RepID=A0ABP7PKE9_9BACT